MIDLKPFCGENHIWDYLNEPFSEGEYSYATNGHIIVRVTRRDDAPEVEPKSSMANKCPKLFADNLFVAETQIPEIPPQVEVDCDCCNGEGVHEYKCSNAPDYPCGECNSTGKIMTEPGTSHWPYIDVSGTHFAPRYLRLLKTLPNVKLSVSSETAPAPFTFDGGDGLLMPMHKT